MNAIKLSYGLYVVIMLVAACKKETVDIQQINGKWYERDENPDFMMDGSITYAISPDSTCIKEVYNALDNTTTTMNWRYILSRDENLITFYGKDGKYTEQYKIIKLNRNEMKWVNASPGDGNYDRRLVRD